jgi:hypothetical protein
MSRRVTAGASSASPEATTRTVSNSCSAVTSAAHAWTVVEGDARHESGVPGVTVEVIR